MPEKIWISLRTIKFLPCTVSLLFIHVAVDVTGSLQANKLSSSSFESIQGKNCTAPTPPVPDAMLKWRPRRDNNIFLPGEKAEFVCKERFRQIGWLETLKCERDGNWSLESSDGEFKSTERAGFCITNHCNGTGVFNCTANNESVDICKRCDCVTDCSDGSDERDCGPILVNVTEHATGEIKYPENTNISFKRAEKCSKTLWTDHLGFYIKLLFTNFSFRGDCDDNYIFLDNATFSDTKSSPDCCKRSEQVTCGFGSKSGAPPLSHSVKNFMIITVIGLNSSEFSAVWFHVNGLFPYGVVPRDDVSFSDYVKLERQQSKKIETEASDATNVTAVVIFSIFVFIVVSAVVCKIGQHFIGPKCSVEYCYAWVAAKRRQRAASRATSPETSPIRREIYDERGHERSHRVQAGDVSRTRYGSAGEIA